MDIKEYRRSKLERILKDKNLSKQTKIKIAETLVPNSHVWNRKSGHEEEA
jgi:hypothetical protein